MIIEGTVCLYYVQLKYRPRFQLYTTPTTLQPRKQKSSKHLKYGKFNSSNHYLGAGETKNQTG